MTKLPATKNPDLGQRIRKRRKYVGLTQAELASELGISFQQMQKYEKGINAVSLARLQRISEVLNLPTNYFLDEDSHMIGQAVPAEGGPVDSTAHARQVTAFLESGEGRRLAEAFVSIKDHRLRTHILDFIASVAADARDKPVG